MCIYTFIDIQTRKRHLYIYIHMSMWSINANLTTKYINSDDEESKLKSAAALKWIIESLFMVIVDSINSFLTLCSVQLLAFIISIYVIQTIE